MRSAADDDAGASGDGRGLRDARRSLNRFHQLEDRTPLLQCCGFIGLDLGLVTVVKTVPVPLIQGAALIATALLTGHLFMLAHDAGHGSLFRRQGLNRGFGRVLFLMTLHSAWSWIYWHNAVHHRWTNLASRDFVWRPFSPTEYRALPRWRRALERLYRHESTVGFAAYYLIEIWAPKMLLPPAARRRHNRAWPLEPLALAAYAAILVVPWSGAASFGIGLGLVAAKLVVLAWYIGFVVYFNHTHPDVRWYAEPDDWRYELGQVDCTVYLRQGGLGRFFLPHVIMSHTAHHVDPLVPLDNLPAAQTALEERFGERITRVVWSWAENRRILRACKLYDYATNEWHGFSRRSPVPEAQNSTLGSQVARAGNAATRISPRI